ncbi:MAG TPA: hypothetical protein VK696_07890 [Steroidobacteraceae bacterium]|jgi:hypothetical protein|nr:hypothetical protein [Steroidobacteraceae bacterium]
MDIFTSAAARSVAATILFGAGVLLADPMARAAAPAAASAPSTANLSPCDRACLRGIAETYLNAMLAHDPSKAPLALNARYTENGVTLTLPDGLWRTLDKLGSYRLTVADPEERSIGFLAKGLENGAPVLIGTRLRVINHQITEMESVVGRLSGTTGGSSFGTPKDASIDGEPRKPFLTDLPAAARLTAAQLGAIVNGYFTGLEGNTGDKPPAFAEDCHRLENETPTTNNPVAAGAQPSAGNFPCAKAFGLGYYREDTRLRNRRILAVDTERGLVYASVFFDHDATVREYKLKDGRDFKVRNTGPWTWMIQELFEVNAAGKISQVEAVLLSVPYGMRPGWVTGAHFPSPQAKQDHFREY